MRYNASVKKTVGRKTREFALFYKISYKKK